MSGFHQGIIVLAHTFSLAQPIKELELKTLDECIKYVTLSSESRGVGVLSIDSEGFVGVLKGLSLCFVW